MSQGFIEVTVKQIISIFHLKSANHPWPKWNLWFFNTGFWRHLGVGRSGFWWTRHHRLVVCGAQWWRRSHQDLFRMHSSGPKTCCKIKKSENNVFLNCRSQRVHCLIGALSGFLVWLEASHSPSMVGPAGELILGFSPNQCDQTRSPSIKRVSAPL